MVEKKIKRIKYTLEKICITNKKFRIDAINKIKEHKETKFQCVRIKDPRSDSNSKVLQRKLNKEDIAKWSPKSRQSSRLPTYLSKEKTPIQNPTRIEMDRKRTTKCSKQNTLKKFGFNQTITKIITPINREEKETLQNELDKTNIYYDNTFKGDKISNLDKDCIRIFYLNINRIN